MMQISVVIPAYSIDRWNTILEAISSIKRQTYTATEIIVAVGENAELASKLQKELPSEIKVILDKNGRGPARTRNLGTNAAKGDVIAFLEDDAYSQPQWLENLVSIYQDPAVLAAGGLVIPLWEGKPPWWLPEELFWVVGCTYKGHPTIKAEVRSLPGCNMSFRREVFKKVGLFNLKFGRPGNLIGAEDTELFVRLHKHFPEAKVIYEPAAIVYHHVPVSRQNIKYVIRRSYGEGAGRAYLRAIYPGALSTEAGLLHYFLNHSIPSRTIAILRGKLPVVNFSHIGIIALSVIVTGTAFLLASLAQKLTELARLTRWKLTV